MLAKHFKRENQGCMSLNMLTMHFRKGNQVCMSFQREASVCAMHFKRENQVLMSFKRKRHCEGGKRVSDALQERKSGLDGV